MTCIRPIQAIKFVGLLISLSIVASQAVWAQQDPSSKAISLRSPDGHLLISFQLATEPALDSRTSAAKPRRLVYSVTFNDRPLINDSALRLELLDQPPLGPNLRIVDSIPAQIDETYRLVTGKTNSARNHCNTLLLALEEDAKPMRKLQIEARAYDDAVAFRYVVPEQPAMTDFRLAKESTEFRISKDATTYALVLPGYRSMYESEFIKLPISAFANQGGVASNVLLGLPLLMEVPGVGWLAITEADLQDYAAMYLTNPSGSWTGHWLESRLAPHVEDAKICVTGNLPHHSAWRVLQVATDPGRLIESNVLTSLNRESEIVDTAWIRAGRAAWDWWNGSTGPNGKHAFTTETIKYYVDFAAHAGLEYMLIDAGWSAGKDITKLNGRVDIPEVVKYATGKNVKVWIWTSYDEMVQYMDEALPLFAKWGVAGIKIDFVERDDQEGIDFYYRVAEKAARHHLMVDFHGCTKPSGLQRTWPNIMGYEAVLGMEQSKAGSRDNPDHHVTLPFTRMLAGPMDYTPGGFDNVTRDEFLPRMERPMVMGTRAHQLSMYVVYEAAFQMVADCPSAYDGQPAFEFIKSVPAAWDETRVISGSVGEYVAVARRHGNQWFLGCMTNWKPRQLEIPLKFLDSGDYLAEIYVDADDAAQSPKNVAIEKKVVNSSGSLTIRLAPGGGFAARLTPNR